MTHEQTGTSFNSAVRKNLKDNGMYYWRVMARKPNANDTWYDHGRFFVGDYSGLEDTQATRVIKKGVYNLQGLYLGENTDNLPKGFYIVNGIKTIL